MASPTPAAVPLDPELARLPVGARIIQAPVFEQPLGLVGEKPPPRHESEDLWRAIDVLREQGIGVGFEALELFLEEYPESAWAPALRSRLALRYRELGRHTLALSHWEAAWAATANAIDPTGSAIADFTLAHWTELLAALGRVEPLAEILGQTADRLLDAGPLLERFLSVQQAFEAMVMEPGHANACGVRAQARNRYTHVQTFYSGITRYYQSQEIDRRGRITYLHHLSQGNLVLLSSVQDPDGNFTYFDYSETPPDRLTQVRAPYGLTAKFFYNANGQLWKIEDAQQLVSQFTYDSQGRIEALITPYGTTTFAWSPDVTPGTGNIVNRALIVTEPGGRKHLYAYRSNSAKLSNASGAPDLLPSSYGPAEVPNTPANDTLNNSGLHICNSFYWGPHQFDALSPAFKNSLVLTDLTVADYRLARSRNWLIQSGALPLVGSALNLERRPGPGGGNPGQLVWFGYDGKPQGWPELEGTYLAPTLVALVLPDGSTRYTRYNRHHPNVSNNDQWGMPRTVTSTYSITGGIGTRTTTYQYDNATGQKLMSVVGQDNQTRLAFTYDPQHPALIKTITRYHTAGQDYTTTYNYNAAGRLQSRLSEGGLTTTYNGVRQLTSRTDPLGRQYHYTYCACGSLESIRNPLNQITWFGYNPSGRLAWIELPGLQTIEYSYNLLGQRVGVADALGAWSATYNNQGRLATVRNPANQLYWSLTYNADDQPTSVAQPNGVTITRAFDYLGRVKTRRQGTLPNEVFVYSARGLISHTDPLGKITQFGYDAAGRKTSETTPKNEIVSYTYNPGGDLLTLTDHRGKVTTWTYDAEGRMLTKRYHGQSFNNLEYLYNANGQVVTRRFRSSASVHRATSYGYDDTGNLTTITYPAGTPNVTFGYDALDRLQSMHDPVFGTTTFGYTTEGRLASEQAPWSQSKISFGYNNALLRSSLTLEQPAGSWTQSYGYDSSRRLNSITIPAISSTPFAYTHLGTSRQVSQVTLPNNAKIINSYDALARLTATRLHRQNHTILNKHDYLYNNRNERTKHTRIDNSYVNFGYDNLGQLTSALGYQQGGSPIANEQLGYTYDAGWNLTQRTVNGVPTTYTVNDRNQATYENTPFWHGYDAHGNRISRTDDGSQTAHYAYDDEQRLVTAHFINAAWTAGWRSQFTYDGLSRLRRSVESTWTSAGGTNGYWTLTSDIRRLYDGRRVIQERNGANTPLVTYTRGPDLSGSFEGAGGIGGLLARSHGYHSTTGGWDIHHYYHADGGGNITAMANNNATSASVVGSYRYDPYGRLISSSLPMAGVNLYRFSSKEFHSNSGLYYYGFRFYDPLLQRWINRDPIFEAGGINLYGFVFNAPLGRIDPWGLEDLVDCDDEFRRERRRNFREGADDFHTVLNETTKDLAITAIPYGRLLKPLRALGGKIGGLFKRKPAAISAPPRLLGPGVHIGDHLADNMARRGWTEPLIRSTIDNPVRTVPWRDTRRLPGGGRMNDPATGYYCPRGGYVVRNDRTGDIVQISDRTNPNWGAPWD